MEITIGVLTKTENDQKEKSFNCFNNVFRNRDYYEKETSEQRDRTFLGMS